jgi:hypothetical protein
MTSVTTSITVIESECMSEGKAASISFGAHLNMVKSTTCA